MDKIKLTMNTLFAGVGIQVYTLIGGKWDKIHELCCRVYSINGISTTINTCSGGNREPKIWMMMKMDEKKEIMKSCNDCIHCPVCYKIEHYGRDTYSAEPCEIYMGKADTKPLVHGHWIQVDETKCSCSNCNIIALIGLYSHGDKNYCPNCGVKMDRDTDDEKQKSC